MRVRLTDHAKTRLLERGIDLALVKKVIKIDGKTKAILGGKVESTADIDEGRRLTVIYEVLSKNEVIIVTAYYAS